METYPERPPKSGLVRRWRAARRMRQLTEVMQVVLERPEVPPAKAAKVGRFGLRIADIH